MTLLFFVALWVVNPGNYFVAASFVGLIFIYYYKIRDLRLSLLFAYLASTIVFTGKKYPILLVPPGILPTEVYPVGYFTSFTITPALILAFVMALVLARDIVNGKIRKIKFNNLEIVLIAFFLWLIVSDLLGSKTPGFSLLFSLAGLGSLVLYLFLKFYVPSAKKFYSLFLSLLSALVVFESVISIQQFVAKSPLAKNIEAQINIEYFGKAVDELEFTFRSLGTFTHANALGVWLSPFLVLLLLVFLKKPGPFSVSVLVLGLTTLAMTLGRSSWLGFMAGMLVMLFVFEKIKKYKVSERMNKYFLSFVLLGIVLFVFFILPRAEKSLFTFSQGGGYFRKIQIQRGLEVILKNPVFGVGSERSVQEGLQLVGAGDPNFSIILNVHDWYILTAIEHGIPAVVFFVALIILYFRQLVKKKFSDLVGIGLLGGVVCSLIAGLFQPFINLQVIILSLAFLQKRYNGGKDA